MQKTSWEFAGCEGKVPYVTKILPREIVSRMRKKNKKNAVGLAVYKCHFCRYYHIGNKFLEGST